MRTLHIAGLALAVAAGFALPLATSADAAMGRALPATQILPVEQAQFFFLGHNFCWYDDGWQGPGWYWCNYAWNTGYGWGGGDGWRGWNRSQWRGNRGPVGNPPHHAPQNNIVRPPQRYAPPNGVVRTPQIRGGAFTRGAAPKGGAGPGARPCPQGKC